MKRWVTRYSLMIVTILLWLLPAVMLVVSQIELIDELRSDPEPMFYVKPIWFSWTIRFWPAAVFTIVLLITLLCWYKLKSRITSILVSLGMSYLLLISFSIFIFKVDTEGFAAMMLTGSGFIAVHLIILFVTLVLHSIDKHQYIIHKNHYLLVMYSITLLVSTGSIGMALLSEYYLKQTQTDLYQTYLLESRHR